MGDAATVVCYLKGADDVLLPDFPSDVLWNNKKWRMLLFFNEDNTVFFAGRQYPFKATAALNKIRDIIMTLIPRGGGIYSEWTNDQISNVNGASLFHPYIEIYHELYPINQIVKDKPTRNKHYHFNDLLESSCYKPYYMYRTLLPWFYIDEDETIPIPSLTIGTQVKCICCGKENALSSESMFCKKCLLECTDINNNDIACCSVCGKRMFVEDMQYIGDDEELYGLCD